MTLTEPVICSFGTRTGQYATAPANISYGQHDRKYDYSKLCLLFVRFDGSFIHLLVAVGNRLLVMTDIGRDLHPLSCDFSKVILL